MPPKGSKSSLSENGWFKNMVVAQVVDQRMVGSNNLGLTGPYFLGQGALF
jgi:hypothetical protein